MKANDGKSVGKEEKGGRERKRKEERNQYLQGNEGFSLSLPTTFNFEERKERDEKRKKVKTNHKKKKEKTSKRQQNGGEDI